MKNVTLLAAAVIAISFASCKKDRTCTCTNSSSASSSTTTDVYTIKNCSKAVGKANCASESQTQSGVTITKDCKLS